jgi:hypothetical protein
MTVLRAIVQAPVLPMFDTRHDLSLGHTIAGQLIRDHHARRHTLLLEQPPQKALGRFSIVAALDQDVEYGSMLIDSSPEPVLLAGDADHDFIKVPFVAGCWKTAADLIGKALAELSMPFESSPEAPK